MPLCLMLLTLYLDYYLAVSFYPEKSIQAGRGAKKVSNEEWGDKKLLPWKDVLLKVKVV